MSLIYKALEKAQQEKAKDDTPRAVIPPAAGPADGSPAPFPRRFPVAGLVSLGGALLCGLYFYVHPGILAKFFEKQETRAAAPSAVVPQRAATPEPAISVTPSAQPAVIAPVPEPEPALEAQDAVPAGIPSAVAPAGRPDIKISGIISDDQSSLVIINGKVLSEGDPVAGGAYVKKIYKDSVVVESQGKEFIIRK